MASIWYRRMLPALQTTPHLYVFSLVWQHNWILLLVSVVCQLHFAHIQQWPTSFFLQDYILQSNLARCPVLFLQLLGSVWMLTVIMCLINVTSYRWRFFLHHHSMGSGQIPCCAYSCPFFASLPSKSKVCSLFVLTWASFPNYHNDFWSQCWCFLSTSLLSIVMSLSHVLRVSGFSLP